MLAMVLAEAWQASCPSTRPTRPGPGEDRNRIEACAVCHTDLHVTDGELPQAAYPGVPDHEVVGMVEAVGAGVTAPQIGTGGVPWLRHRAYGETGHETLRDAPGFTGCTRDGVNANHVLAKAAFTILLNPSPDPVETAQLPCAGLTGWRTLRVAGPSEGGGGRPHEVCAADHSVAQACRRQGRRSPRSPGPVTARRRPSPARSARPRRRDRNKGVRDNPAVRTGAGRRRSRAAQRTEGCTWAPLRPCPITACPSATGRSRAPRRER